jgi:hypothetical protein
LTKDCRFARFCRREINAHPWAEGREHHFENSMTQIGPYSAVQVANAKTINSFWLNYAKPWHAIGFVANADRETSLNPRAIGDNDTAFNIGQWHWARGQIILAKTGIDVRTCPLENALVAMHSELTQPWGCPKIWQEILATQSCTEAAVAICTLYERAGAADAQERSVALAAYWKAQFKVGDP